VATKAKSLLKPVILARLQAQDRAMLMLYRAGAAGATVDELAAWLREGRKDHLRTRLRRLDSQQLVLEHPQTGKFHRPSISWTAGTSLVTRSSIWWSRTLDSLTAGPRSPRPSYSVPDRSWLQRFDITCNAPLDRLSRRGSDESPPVALFGHTRGRAWSPKPSSALLKVLGHLSRPGKLQKSAPLPD
jgi:hypothetical protein